MFLHTTVIRWLSTVLSMFRKLRSRPFNDYFEHEIHPRVGTKLGRVLLERRHRYIWNRFEYVERLRHGSRTSLSLDISSEVDTALLTLFHLQGYFINVIELGKYKQYNHCLNKNRNNLHIIMNRLTTKAVLIGYEMSVPWCVFYRLLQSRRLPFAEWIPSVHI